MKKLRRVGIADATAANAFLETTYLPEHNARFGVGFTGVAISVHCIRRSR